ncbi:hypothetical protein HU200_021148 [Digitaria exilis]|uniref:Uncharacterized protein n=1 Tax=Digitaria exilis TaxID=1010633 RepID=A0A835K9N5_9POAL|nr:hypothetical protein HU200_021148 [Digitaria exilis]
MTGANGYQDSHVRVTSRRLVTVSESTIKPHVVAVANLDLLPHAMPVSMISIYPNSKPPATDFDAVVAAFESGLPCFLNHFFLFAGRITTNSLSGLPEVRCNNQGAELVVGESCGVALATLDYGTTSQCLHRIELPFAADVALSVQVVSFAFGGSTGVAHQPFAGRRERPELQRLLLPLYTLQASFGDESKAIGVNISKHNMASVNGSNLRVRVVSRRLVKASDSSMEPHVLPVSNLDLLPQSMQTSLFCIYAKPPSTGDFESVVTAFAAGLPSFLNHFFPLAGRIAANPHSGLPEVHCSNQGAELVVGEANVTLASLDYGRACSTLSQIKLPYSQDVALSVQLVSFRCGGFTVAWCTNHVLMDGSSMRLVKFFYFGSFRVRFLHMDPWMYNSASLHEAFTPLDKRHQVNVLTTQQSMVERLYYIDASAMARLRDAASHGSGGARATRMQAISAYLWKALASVVGEADECCRMAWWVDGRARLTKMPKVSDALTNYIGNVIAFVVREESVQDILRTPLPDVAAMVREAIAAPAYDEHFQELVDWVEKHKTKRYIDTASIGLGSPAPRITASSSVPLDTDFGLGQKATVTIMTATLIARLCAGFVHLAPRSTGDGSWIANAFIWPPLAAVLESDEPRIFKDVTAEYLGLSCPQVLRGRL